MPKVSDPIRSVGVYGSSGNVFCGSNVRPIAIVSPAGTEALAVISGSGAPKGAFGVNPMLAVDQSNAHVLEFDPEDEAAREFDAAGGFVAEFGSFTRLTKPYRIAIDSACALHDPPLTEATTPTCKEFDPADGTTYVAFDDTKPGSYDLTAFGPLAYGEAPLATTGSASDFGPGTATLNASVNPRGFDLNECDSSTSLTPST